MSLSASFERSCAAIGALVAEDDFDQNALNALVERHGGIVAELAALPAETLRPLLARHQAVVAAVEAAKARRETLLGRIRAGDKALDAYRR